MIHTELIYLAEQIAEKHGGDHVWVEQLRDLSEEVKSMEVDDGLVSYVGKDGNVNKLDLGINFQTLNANSYSFNNGRTRVKPEQTDATAMVYNAWQDRDKNKSDDENLDIISEEFGMHYSYVQDVLDVEHKARKNT